MIDQTDAWIYPLCTVHVCAACNHCVVHLSQRREGGLWECAARHSFSFPTHCPPQANWELYASTLMCVLQASGKHGLVGAGLCSSCVL